MVLDHPLHEADVRFRVFGPLVPSSSSGVRVRVPAPEPLVESVRAGSLSLARRTRRCAASTSRDRDTSHRAHCRLTLPRIDISLTIRCGCRLSTTRGTMTKPFTALRRRRPSASHAVTALGALVARSPCWPRCRRAGDGRSTRRPRAGFENRASPRAGSELLANRPSPQLFNPAKPGDFGFVNSDLSLRGSCVRRDFNGFQIYDISNPANPTIRTTVVCPCGQGEVSVYRNLVFMSAGRRVPHRLRRAALPSGDPLRFRGVRTSTSATSMLRCRLDGPDLPRLAHAHVVEAPARPQEHLRLRLRNGRRPLGHRASGCVNTPATDPTAPSGASR